MLVLRFLVFLLVLAVAALALSGCGTPWRVLSQANPNPFGARSKLTVHKMTFENLQVGEKSDKQYAGEKEDKTAAAWEGDKAEMAQAFARAFIEAQEPLQTGDNGDFVVQLNCTFIEPGFYAYVASAPAEIHVRVRIVDSRRHARRRDRDRPHGLERHGETNAASARGQRRRRGAAQLRTLLREAVQGPG